MAGGQGFSLLFNPSLPCVCSLFLPLSLLPWSTHKHRTHATTERNDRGTSGKVCQLLSVCVGGTVHSLLLYPIKYSLSSTFLGDVLNNLVSILTLQ